MSDEGLREAIEAVHGLISPLKVGEFSERLYKVQVYVESIEKSWIAYSSDMDGPGQEIDPEKRRKASEARARSFEASVKGALRFASMNLDATMVLALEAIAKKPKVASKTDEKRKADSLQKAFDGLPDPAKSMLEHFRSTSDPLDKYLVAGPWGFEYLNKKQIETGRYYGELCSMLSCEDSAAGKIVLSYGKLKTAIGSVEGLALKAAKGFAANYEG